MSPVQSTAGTASRYPAGAAFDGNNVLDAYAATKLAANACREGRGPVLLIADTFRMGGHATHDEREARATFDATLFEHWGKRDPIGLYETYLIEGTMDLESGRRIKRGDALRERNAETLRRVESQVIEEMDRAADDALASSRNNMPEPHSAADGVYAGAEPALEEAAVVTAIL